MARITKDQQAIIDSLTCERLTDKAENKGIIQDFVGHLHNRVD